MGGHHRGGFCRGADGDDLEVDQLAPGGAPGVEQGAVVGLHDLPAGGEVEVHPAGHVLQPVDEVPTFLAQAAVDLGGGAGLEALDHHVEHAFLSPTIPAFRGEGERERSHHRAPWQNPAVNRIALAGFSIAGVETAIEVPSLGLVLDLGRCSRTAINHPIVVVSHGHLDHVGAVVQHAARRAMMNMGESVFLVSPRIAADVERLFDAAGALDGHAVPRRIVPLAPGDDFPIDKKRWVRPFETFHRVPSQGYTVWERRHHLREEFRHLDGPRLGELRRAGTVLDEAHDVPLLSFTGDTRVEVLERTPELQRTESLVIETSFLDERVSVEEARAMGHIHLDELTARAALLPAHDVVLHHFSARYAPGELAQVCARRLPDELKTRVRLLGADGTPAAMPIP